MRKCIAVIISILTVSAIYAQNITISEINYKADKSNDPNDWLELWNYGSEPVDMSNWILQGEKFNEFFIIPDGTVMYPDDRLVFCRFDEEFEKVFPHIPYLGPFTFRLSGKGQLIRLYNSNNELLIEMAYKDSLPWPKTPDGHGKTLELRDPYGNLNDGNNWFAGCVMGSPGKPYTGCKSDIVFTEVMHTSEDPINSGDWVEIKNIGSSTIDLSGWSFVNRSDTLHFYFPAGTKIEPGAYLVMNRRNKFRDYYPNVNHVGRFEFNVRGHREVLKLYDNHGKIYNSMFYHNEAPWPVEAGVNSKTLEIKDVHGILCDADNWFAGCPGGSPGSEFSNDCKWATISVEQEIIASASKAYPNPFSNSTRIDVNTNLANVKEKLVLQVFDFSGREVVMPQQYMKSDVSQGNASKISIEFSRNSLQRGIYFYHLSHESGLISSGKLMVTD
jgi:hypothetical protein